MKPNYTRFKKNVFLVPKLFLGSPQKNTFFNLVSS